MASGLLCPQDSPPCHCSFHCMSKRGQERLRGRRVRLSSGSSSTPCTVLPARGIMPRLWCSPCATTQEQVSLEERERERDSEYSVDCSLLTVVRQDWPVALCASSPILLRIRTKLLTSFQLVSYIFPSPASSFSSSFSSSLVQRSLPL